MNRFDELRFIRIQDFNLIPRYMMEQVKGGDTKVNRVLQFGTQIAKDPLTLLYVLADTQNKIKGFLWAEIDVFDEVIHVNTLSLDKEYQDRNGTALLKTVDFLKSLLDGSKLQKKITFSTTRPKAFERLGFKRTALVNMEIE